MISLIESVVSLILNSEAYGLKIDHFGLISMMGFQGFYPLEQHVRQTPEFSIDF